MPHTPLLEQIEIFADLNKEQLQRISGLCSERYYEQGDIVFHEYTKSDELYVILEGAVEIQVDPQTLGIAPEKSPGPTAIATLRRGQSFGEIALVDEGIRSASARCAAPATRLLAIPRDGLIQLCRDDCEMGYALMRNLASDLAFKIRQTDLIVREQLLWSPREQAAF
jgi:CRP/FNR family cyclic AMP-dependent transcriptional regulator